MQQLPSLDDLGPKQMEEGRSSPVTKFRGRLDDARVSYDERRSRAVVTFYWSDIEVIVSDPPYPYPTFSFTINSSNRASSSFGVLVESVSKIFGHKDWAWSEQMGKTFVMELTPDHRFGNNREGNPIIASCWEAQAIEGEGAVGIKPSDKAIELLSGKTLAEFQQLALADPVVREDAALVGLILSGGFVTSLLATGKVVVDDDQRYHVVQADAS